MPLAALALLGISLIRPIQTLVRLVIVLVRSAQDQALAHALLAQITFHIPQELVLVLQDII